MKQRCIPDVVLKNKGRTMNVHVVNTDSYMLGPTSMFMDCLRKKTYQCAQYKLKNSFTKHDSRYTKVSIF